MPRRKLDLPFLDMTQIPRAGAVTIDPSALNNAPNWVTTTVLNGLLADTDWIAHGQSVTVQSVTDAFLPGSASAVMLVGNDTRRVTLKSSPDRSYYMEDENGRNLIVHGCVS